MKKNSRHRSTAIGPALNKNKCRALKVIDKAILGHDVLPTQIQGSQALLLLLSQLEREAV